MHVRFQILFAASVAGAFACSMGFDSQALTVLAHHDGILRAARIEICDRVHFLKCFFEV